MTDEPTFEELQVNGQMMLLAIRDTSLIMGFHLPTIDLFLEEAASVDSVLPMLDPTRWKKMQEHKDYYDALEKTVRAAKAFVEASEELKQTLAPEDEDQI